MPLTLETAALESTGHSTPTFDEVAEHAPVLLAAARLLLRNEAEARDLVQTTCEIGMRRVGDLRDPERLLPSPSPVPTPSALVDGLPTSIDGKPVLRGDDLRAAITSSTDDTPFLAGGYLQSRVSVFNCRVVPADESADAKAIDQCFSFGLYDQLVGGLVIWVSRGDAGLLTADMIGVDRPVVVRLHTHDSRCTQPYCAQTPVLVSVAWLGAIGTGGVSPTPHPTPPVSTITRAQAIANARAAGAEGDFPSNSTVRSVEVELETEALPAWWPQEVDPWVWAIILDAPDGRAELVLLDYVTGDLIYSQSPLP